MGSIVRFCMKNALAMILATLMIVGAGIYSVTQMHMEQFPNVDIPFSGLSVNYPGASPQQAMDDIGKPLETELAHVKNVKNLYVWAYPASVSITMEFNMGQSMEEAGRLVRDAVAKVKLPDSATKPQYYSATADSPEVYSIGLSGSHIDSIEQYVNQTLQPHLSAIPGVDSVHVRGVGDKKVYVNVFPDQLKKYNLSLDKVKQALVANNVSLPTGDVTIAGQTLPIQLTHTYGSLNDIKDTPLIVVETNSSGLTDAFLGIQSGMSQLGGAVSSLGSGEEALAKSQGLMQGEIQLVSALQGLMGPYMADAAQLQQMQAAAQQHPGTVDPGSIATQQKKVANEKDQITRLQDQLSQIEKQLAAMGDSQSLQSGSSQGFTQRKGTSGTSSPPSSLSPSVTVKTIRLGDVADITYGAPSSSTLTRINGKPAVTLGIVPQSGQNVVDIVKQAKDVLQKATLPAGAHLTVLRDQSGPIKDSVYAMLREALLGALFATIVTLLFLRNLRATIVAIISIPLSILASMIILNTLGYSLNIMTLSGIAVATGRVVDDSIVVIENIYRRLRGARDGDTEVVEHATLEVAKAITASTVTTVGVFLPMAFVPGIVGRFFAPFAWTIVVSLIFSLLVAISVAPLLSRLTLAKVPPTEHHGDTRLARVYCSVLAWSLSHRSIVLVLSTVLLIASFGLVPKLGFNFLPQDSVRYYTISVDMPLGSSINRTNEVARNIEEVLGREKDVNRISTSVSSENANVSFSIADKVKDTDTIANRIRKGLGEVQGAKSVALQGLGGPAGDAQVFIIVNGPNTDAIRQAAEKITSALQPVKGLANLTNSVTGARPQLSIELLNDKAAPQGLTPMMVAGALHDMVSGSPATSMSIDGRSTDVVVQLKTDPLTALQTIEDQKLTTVTGSTVRLGDIAHLSYTKGPTSLERLNQADFAQVTASITDPNSGKVNNQVTSIVNKLTLPQGTSWRMEGAAKNIAEGFQSLGLAIIVSIVLVYMVMLIAFGEALAPFSILFALPFTIIGALVGLWVVHEPIGMPALIGLLMLVGIVVTNAIVLMDRVQRNRRHGVPTREALLEAGAVRVRPILMTAIATIGALIPLTLSSDAGLISKSLAVVVIGGLATSTFLTLVVVPIVYLTLDRVRDRILRRGKVLQGVEQRPQSRLVVK